MKQALFTYKYGDMAEFEKLGYEVTYIPEETLPDQFSLEGYEVLVCFNPFPKLDMDTLSDLRLIQLVSKGVNQVPDSLRNNPRITITNNVTGPAVPIGELIVSYILQIFKNARFFYDRQNEKCWQANPDILEITGKTIGFLGTGNIAQEAAVRLRPFGAKLIGVSRHGNPVSCFDRVDTLDRLEDLLRESNVVVSTLPATDETYHLLNADTFAVMKRGVTLVNISRGSVIDEQALIHALADGLFRGVALDVFETEPLPADSPLWSDPRVIVTPHNALYSDWYDTRVFRMIYDNLKNYIEDMPLQGIVDYSRGY